MPQLGAATNPLPLGAIAASAVWRMAVLATPVARRVFDAEWGLRWGWLVVAALALTPVTVIEVVKLLRRRGSREGEAPAEPRRHP